MRYLKLCMTVGLILAVSATANALMVVTPSVIGDGSTEWVNTTAAVGSSSLQLNDPGGTYNYVGVWVTNLGDPKVEDFDGWDYWTRGPEFHGVNLTLWLDTPYDNPPGESWDVILEITPYNTLSDEGGTSAQPIPGDTWVNLDSATRYPYAFFAYDGTGNYLGGHDIATQSNAITWSEFQALEPIYADVDWNEPGEWGYTYDFSEAIIKDISIEMGGGGHSADHTGYLDDFTLNGVPVVLEDGFTVIPEPLTILAVFGGIAGIGGYLRKRRRA